MGFPSERENKRLRGVNEILLDRLKWVMWQLRDGLKILRGE